MELVFWKQEWMARGLLYQPKHKTNYKAISGLLKNSMKQRLKITNSLIGNWDPNKTDITKVKRRQTIGINQVSWLLVQSSSNHIILSFSLWSPLSLVCNLANSLSANVFHYYVYYFLEEAFCLHYEVMEEYTSNMHHTCI